MSTRCVSGSRSTPATALCSTNAGGPARRPTFPGRSTHAGSAIASTMMARRGSGPAPATARPLDRLPTRRDLLAGPAVIVAGVDMAVDVHRLEQQAETKDSGDRQIGADRDDT